MLYPVEVLSCCLSCLCGYYHLTAVSAHCHTLVSHCHTLMSLYCTQCHTVTMSYHNVMTCVIITPGMDYITRTITVDSEPVLLQLWDTAGQERFGPITAVYCRRADAFILVYDITNRSSFVGIKGWTDVIKV